MFINSAINLKIGIVTGMIIGGAIAVTAKTFRSLKTGVVCPNVQISLQIQIKKLKMQMNTQKIN